jgi:uncharacterized protein
MADITVEVVLALRDHTLFTRLQLAEGSCAGLAIEKSGFAQKYPDYFSPLYIGIFSSPISPEHRLYDGDRIEIYRPLKCDPKQYRRLRSEKKCEKHD